MTSITSFQQWWKEARGKSDVYGIIATKNGSTDIGRFLCPVVWYAGSDGLNQSTMRTSVPKQQVRLGIVLD